MHPDLYEHIAQQHREELQREAAIAQAVRLAHADDYTSRRILYHLMFDLPAPSSPLSEASLSQAIVPSRLQEHMRTALGTIGMAAFGLGSLLGGFLGTRFGLLPATLLGCIMCLTMTLPILRRSLKVLSKHV